MDDFSGDIVYLFIQLLKLGKGLLVPSKKLSNMVLELLFLVSDLQRMISMTYHRQEVQNSEEIAYNYYVTHK